VLHTLYFILYTSIYTSITSITPILYSIITLHEAAVDLGYGAVSEYVVQHRRSGGILVALQMGRCNGDGYVLVALCCRHGLSARLK
jgi:hypothetical protein